MHNEAMEIKMGERQHPKIRHFSGRPYHLHGEEIMSKSGAESTAEYWRNRGVLVRIVKERKHNEWLLYVRWK